MCQNALFAIKEKCKNYNHITISNENDIVELRDYYCITNLFQNRVGNYTQVNNDHVPTVETKNDIMAITQAFV